MAAHGRLGPGGRVDPRFYGATAMLLAATWGRTVLPMGEYTREATVPGERPVVPLQFERGEPGVRQGQ